LSAKELELQTKIDIESYKHWVERILETWRGQNETKTVGFLHHHVLRALGGLGIAPEGAAIEIMDKDVLHLMRDGKANRRSAIHLESLFDLPTILESPKAILLDKRDHSLLYVFEVKGGPKLGKFVIHAGMRCKVYSDGNRAKRAVNQLATAGMVSRINLADKSFYEVIIGAL
jgi:hypothetical protein